MDVIKYAKSNNIEYIYHGGDTFHTPGSIPTQALSIFQGFLSSLNSNNIKFRTLVGNHDQANRIGNIHPLNTNFIKGNLTAEPGEIKHWVDDGLNVFAMGYTESEDKIKELLEVASRTPSMVLMHQGVAGVPLSSGYVIDERLSPSMIPNNCRVFTGHYHYHKQVTPNLTVIGNLTALNWSDIDQIKGFLVWDDETNETEFIESGAPRFISLRHDMDWDDSNSCFVRFMGEVSLGESRAIRKDLLDRGAITVEFPSLVKAFESEINRDSFKAKDYLKELEKDLEPRRLKVGQEIREENYEIN
jgi:DNA repair exonuclease SbcCD nuclease subunit